MTSKKRVLILGGLGFIGKNLFLNLNNDGHSVTLFSNRIENVGDGFPTEKFRANIIHGNLLDKKLMEEVVTGYDVIYSLAGSSGASDSIVNPYQDLDTNLKGHLNLLEACKKNNRASRKIIEKNGGILENQVKLENGKIELRFWIKNI